MSSQENKQELMRPVYQDLGSAALRDNSQETWVRPRYEQMSELAIEQVLNQTTFNNEDSRDYATKNAPPKYALGEIDGAKVFLSDIIENINDQSHPFIAAYIQPENEKYISPRLFYRSNSSMLWRFLPKMKNRHFGKSTYGEDAMNAPFLLQATIEDLRQRHPSSRSAKESEMVMSFDDPAIPLYGEYGDLQDYGDMREIITPREIGDKRSLTPEDYYHGTIEVMSRNCRLYSPADPETCVVSDNLSPDFSKVTAAWRTQNDIYGSVMAECFDSKDSSLKYLFFQNNEGRAWVGAVELNRSKLSSAGVKQEFIRPGSLTTPLYEYHTNNVRQDFRRDGTGYWGNPNDRKGHYVGMDEYLNRIPMIQEYLES